MRGIKLELLGLGVILLGMALSANVTNHFLTYACGILGFGMAACGCFFMKELEGKADE